MIKNCHLDRAISTMYSKLLLSHYTWKQSALFIKPMIYVFKCTQMKTICTISASYRKFGIMTLCEEMLTFFQIKHKRWSLKKFLWESSHNFISLNLPGPILEKIQGASLQINSRLLKNLVRLTLSKWNFTCSHILYSHVK